MLIPWNKAWRILIVPQKMAPRLTGMRLKSPFLLHSQNQTARHWNSKYFRCLGISSQLFPHRCDCFSDSWREPSCWNIFVIAIIDPNCSLHFQIPEASLDCIQVQENNDEIQALPHYLSYFFFLHNVFNWPKKVTKATLNYMYRYKLIKYI